MNFKVKVLSNRSEYYKDWEDLYIEVDGRRYTMRNLYDRIIELETDNKELNRELEEFKDAQAHIDELFTRSIELLSTKVARLELLVEEQKEEN